MNIEQQYLSSLREILDYGEEKHPERKLEAGRKLSHYTKGISCIQLMHNMNDGFPLYTHKKMGLKTIAVELEGFIKGITDKRWYQDRFCYIWNSWCNPKMIEEGYDKETYQKEDNDLGPVYGYQWRKFNAPYKPIPTIHTHFDKQIKISTDKTSKYIGQKYINKFGEYIVIDSFRKNKQTRFKIQFIKTGYITEVSHTNLRHNEVKDKFAPAIFSVACRGNADNHPLRKRLERQWYNMISRCYYKKDKDYHRYGAVGVYVENRWLILENFLNDVNKIKGWDKKENNWNKYSLDKDFSGLNYYGLKSCEWKTAKEQSSMRRKTYSFEATSPDGKKYISNSVVEFAKEHNLDNSTIGKILKGKIESTKGWVFQNKQNIKYEYVDQFKNMVDSLKTSPNDRRIVVSAWNPEQFDQMALVPCHMTFGVTSYQGKLDLWCLIRSNDMLLGNPYNVASYALLLLLLAKESNLIANKLSLFIVDAHLYSNQFEAATQALGRQIHKLPTVEITGEQSIFDWTHKDFVLSGYVSEGPLDKVEVVV